MDLTEFNELERDEQRAFLGFFAGAKSKVTKLPDKSEVTFGKYECEQPDFNDFWLNKLPELGWVTITEKKLKCLGIEGHPEAIEYTITATDSGQKVREAYWTKLA